MRGYEPVSDMVTAHERRGIRCTDCNLGTLERAGTAQKRASGLFLFFVGTDVSQLELHGARFEIMDRLNCFVQGHLRNPTVVMLHEYARCRGQCEY
jgi:hypothetical protein